MRSEYYCLRFIAATVSLAAFALTCGAAEITGRVVGVHDGDTITVLDASKTQYKIRLAGIDAWGV